MTCQLKHSYFDRRLFVAVNQRLVDAALLNPKFQERLAGSLVIEFLQSEASG